MSYSFVPCDGIGLTDLAEAVNAAFSDYLVPMQIDKADFGAMMHQRGFAPDFSHVAISANGDIAAFWLSGEPSWAYENAAYTISTGTLPNHRRKGLLKRLFASVKNRLAEVGTKKIQLEVIAGNQKAIFAYLGLGFVPQRELLVYRIDKSGIVKPTLDGIRIAPVLVGDLPKESPHYFASLPAPQNSLAALLAAGNRVTVLGACQGKTLVGWGAIDVLAGAVVQIAVHKAHRRQGIGTSLLNALADKTGQEALIFANIDQNDTGSLAFLAAQGGASFLCQQEMVYKM